MLADKRILGVFWYKQVQVVAMLIGYNVFKFNINLKSFRYRKTLMIIGVLESNKNILKWFFIRERESQIMWLHRVKPKGFSDKIFNRRIKVSYMHCYFKSAVVLTRSIITIKSFLICSFYSVWLKLRPICYNFYSEDKGHFMKRVGWRVFKRNTKNHHPWPSRWRKVQV